MGNYPGTAKCHQTKNMLVETVRVMLHCRAAERELRADCKWMLPIWRHVEMLEEEYIRVLPELLGDKPGANRLQS